MVADTTVLTDDLEGAADYQIAPTRGNVRSTLIGGERAGLVGTKKPAWGGLRALSEDGAGDRIRTGDPLLGKHDPLCAVLQTWEQREMLSSYLLLRSSLVSTADPTVTYR